MATGLIGTSAVPFNSTHGSGFGVPFTLDGATLSYTCPASGARYAVVNICASVAIADLPASGTNGAEPKVSAGTLQLRLEKGSLQHVYSVILAPGQSWTGKASSTVFVNSGGAVSPETYAYLTASALEVV